MRVGCEKRSTKNMSYHGPGGVVGGERTEFKYNEHISAQTNCRTLFPTTRQVDLQLGSASPANVPLVAPLIILTELAILPELP